MHRLRKELLVRLILVIMILGGITYYAFDTVSGTMSQAARVRAKPFTVKNVALPSGATRDLIAMGVSLVEEKGRGGQLSYLISSLVEKKEGKVETARLTLIALGQKERYAMINNRMYRVGDSLPDGRRIVALNGDGAVLSALGHSELLPWVPPLKVELKKTAPAPAVDEEAADEKQVVESPVEKKVEKVVMNADKAMQLLKQLEALGGSK